MVVVVIQNIECPVLLFGNLETIATAIDMIMIMLCLACLCNKVFSFPDSTPSMLLYLPLIWMIMPFMFCDDTSLGIDEHVCGEERLTNYPLC